MFKYGPSLLRAAILAVLFLTAGIHAVSAQSSADRILFIRGGIGTVGFFEGGSDEQGADISNYQTNGGNHGWGELNDALTAEGFISEQMSEDPVNSLVPTPVPLDTMDLSVYAVIVFGSNNAAYTTAQIDALESYIDQGGSALFISDANFGQDWGDAPSSDQHFLDRFGLTMNQDTGTYTIRRTDEFVVPAHPILNGVDIFDGEGVSPISVGTAPAGVTTTLLTLARGNVRQNTGSTQGPTQAAGANDGSLVIATLGSGRVAGHYDRNTFFNLNGAGTDIRRFDNEIYARNLFNWLAGRPVAAPGDNYSPRGHFINLTDGATLGQNDSVTIELSAYDPDGSIAHVDLFLNGGLVSRVSTAPYSSWAVSGLSLGVNTLTVVIEDDGGEMTTIERNVVAYSELDNSGWTVSGFKSNGDPNGTPANAIDGDLTSRWTTNQVQTPGQRFLIDLGQRETFSRIVLLSPNHPNDYPRSYVVRGSHDGASYTALVSSNGDGPRTEITLPDPATYRYIEIEQTGSDGSSWWSIQELQIFAPLPTTVFPLSAWRLLHFGAELDDSAKESTHWGLTADFDGDGQSTLQEFAFNTDPRDASSGSSMEHAVGTDSNDGKTYHDFSFRRWEASNDLQYTILHSDNLSQWLPTGFEASVTEGPNSNDDGTEDITYRIKPNDDLDTSFVRLQFTIL